MKGGTYAISAVGSGISYGALSLVVAIVLQASDMQVSLLSAAAGLAGAVMILPLGHGSSTAANTR